jgi:FkbM family methyltransferase
MVTGNFGADEPEFERLSDWVGEGDWAIDVGANIGSYALELSRLVGPLGRVIAIEPVPATFHFLSRHVVLGGCANVTLLNLAASDHCRETGITLPSFESGLMNPYQARLSETGEFRILTIQIDGLELEGPIRLVKIDVEGHEMNVLRGMRCLLERHRPVVVLEGDRQEFLDFLAPMGYRRESLAGSPNTIFVPS